MDRPKSSPLTRTQWTTKQPVITKVTIIEADIKDAGMSIIRRDKLLPQSLINQLEKLPKHDRSVQVGKLSRTEEYRGLSKTITVGLKQSMLEFCNANEIPDHDIISVKRDAVFIKNIKPRILVFDNDLVEFKLKNIYTDFMVFNGIEMYFNYSKRTVDIKGIADLEKSLHQDYLIKLIFDILELVRLNKYSLILDTLVQFRMDYVTKDLPLGFYRELNSTSGFPLELGKNKYVFKSVTEDKFEYINIQYNLVNVIIPLVKHFIEG